MDCLQICQITSIYGVIFFVPHPNSRSSWPSQWQRTPNISSSQSTTSSSIRVSSSALFTGWYWSSPVWWGTPGRRNRKTRLPSGEIWWCRRMRSVCDYWFSWVISVTWFQGHSCKLLYIPHHLSFLYLSSSLHHDHYFYYSNSSLYSGRRALSVLYSKLGLTFCFLFLTSTQHRVQLVTKRSKTTDMIVRYLGAAIAIFKGPRRSPAFYSVKLAPLYTDTTGIMV